MGAIQSGDTAWVLLCAAMVMFMTPGLALLYGGLVRARFALSTMYMSTAAVAVVGLTWFAVGYSLAFAPSDLPFIGGMQWFLFNGVGMEPSSYAPTIPHSAFALFQGMAAIITPAVISGSLVERVRVKPWLLFLVAWTVLVYCPLAHAVWAEDGWLKAKGLLDYSGGYVIHIALAFSALTFTQRLGARKTFGKEDDAPHNIFMAVVGAGILWFGWLGFNGGCAAAADGLASQAVTNTFLSSAAGFLAWMAAETTVRGKPSTLGPLIGAIAGLVAIGAGAPYVSGIAALLFGLVASLGCFYATPFIKKTLKIDDTLDVFACHGVGGIVGVLLTGLLADRDALQLLKYKHSPLVLIQAQVIGVLIVAAYSVIATYAIVRVLEAIMPLRTALAAAGDDDDHAELGETLENETKPTASAPVVVPTTVDAAYDAWHTLHVHQYLTLAVVKEWIAAGGRERHLTGVMGSARRLRRLGFFAALTADEKQVLNQAGLVELDPEDSLAAVRVLCREVMHAASLKPAWFSTLPVKGLISLTDAALDHVLVEVPANVAALALFAIPASRMNRLTATLARSDIDTVLAALAKINRSPRETAVAGAQMLETYLTAADQGGAPRVMAAAS